MKRLILEGDCTMLERSLLSSIDLDIPSPRAVEKVRSTLVLMEDSALAPVVGERRGRKLQQSAAIAAVFVLAAGIAILIATRQNRTEAMRKDPSLPITTNAPVPVAPPPPVESVLAPGIMFEPPPAPTPSVAPVRSARPQPPAHASGPASAEDVLGAALGDGPAPSTSVKRLPAGLPQHRGAAFDKGAAAGALGKVDLTDCKAIPGPDGMGHVTVTFRDDGTVQSAVVDGGPFPGTARGGCIAGKFRSVSVPPFDGSAVRVGKSFTL